MRFRLSDDDIGTATVDGGPGQRGGVPEQRRAQPTRGRGVLENATGRHRRVRRREDHAAGHERHDRRQDGRCRSVVLGL